MYRDTLAWFLDKILVPIFFLTLFWQTRINILGVNEIYDYLIPFIYLSDILIVAIIGVQFVVRPTWFFDIWKKHHFWVIGIVGFLVWLEFISFGVIHSVGAIYKLIKLGLMFGFSVWIIGFVWEDKENLNRILRLVTVGLIPLVGLGLIEMVLGQTLGLRLIGEWFFTIANPAVSRVNLFGYEIMRPYASFPHPNVFGGVMGAVGLSMFALFQKTKAKNIGLTMILFFGLFISFSRSAWLGVGVGIIYLLLMRYEVIISVFKKIKIWWFLPGLMIAFFFSVLMISRVSDLLTEDHLSITRRQELNQVAAEMWQDNLLTGVGLNQFVLEMGQYWDLNKLPRFSQPVHNIFLLILVETGLIGFLIWLCLFVVKLIQNWKKLGLEVQVLWIVIFVTGFFDHYWWTLQSGMLMLFLTLGLTLARMEESTT